VLEDLTGYMGRGVAAAIPLVSDGMDSLEVGVGAVEVEDTGDLSRRSSWVAGDRGGGR
jgi:hypothetical protein